MSNIYKTTMGQKQIHFLLLKVITTLGIFLSASGEGQIDEEGLKICNDLLHCEFGEVCTAEGICAPTTTTTNNTEKIICSLSQLYDEVNKKCVSLVGENCELDEDCIKLSNCESEWDSKLHRFQGKCRCASGGKFYLNVTSGSCEKRAKYLEFCSEEVPCELSHFLSCQSGQCQCIDEQRQTYDVYKKSCVLKLGQSCYEYRRHGKTICGLNAECIFHFNDRRTPTCKCLKGYISTPEGNCKADYGTQCNNNNDTTTTNSETNTNDYSKNAPDKPISCAEGKNLECSDGICQCESPLTQKYDLELQKCVKTVGSSCTTTKVQSSTDTHTGFFEDCISHASCISNVCQCDSGYSVTSQLNCHLDFGQRCNSSSSSRLCNADAGLACKSGLCKCFDSSNLIYDSHSKVCRLSHGKKNAPCGFVEDSLQRTKYQVRCSHEFECVQQSGCVCDFMGHPQYKQKEFCVRGYL